MTLEDGGKETFSGYVGAITTTYDGVIFTCENGASNGGLQLFSIEYTDSFTCSSEMNLKLPPPHIQNFQGDSNASMQVFLEKEYEPAVDGESVRGDDDNPKNIVMMYDAL